jgi:hypothetical protein
VALSVLDEYIARAPGGPGTAPSTRQRRRGRGLPNFRLVRFADDWCLVVSGTRADAELLRDEIAGVLATMGLRLSEEKTLITHIGEGLDFLGWRIQRHRKRGTNRYYVCTYPSRKAVKALMGKVWTHCRTTGTNLPRRPAHPAQPDAAGLVRLLSARRVQRHLPVPQLLHLGPGHHMDTTQTPPDHLEGPPPSLLRRRMVAGQCGTRTVQPGEGTHHALPLPGISHPPALARKGMRPTRQATTGLAERPVP